MVLKLVNNLTKKEVSIINVKNINQSNNYNFRNIKKINFNLTLNKNTGDLFLKNPSNFKNLICPHSWLKYNEPEEHLKKIIKIYEDNFSVNEKFVIGVSYKDQSFIDNLDINKIKKKKILDPIKDLKLNKNFGIESIQDRLSRIKNVDLNYKKKPDLIVARHVWEHFYRQDKFVRLLRNISDENTLFYFEIPDCEKSIKNYDYSMLWEEHIHYYSMSTFISSLENFNFQIVKYGRYKYPYEDVLYAFFKLKNNKNKKFKKINKDIKKIQSYGKKFEYVKKNLSKKLEIMKKTGDLGVIGASHMANSVISFFKLDPHISYVFDGDKNKIGKYYFKNRIKIRDIQEILHSDCRHFIVAINPMHKKFIKLIKKKLLKNKKTVSDLFSKKFYLNK